MDNMEIWTNRVIMPEITVPACRSFGDFVYTVSAGGAAIVRYLGRETVVHVPNAIDGVPVRTIADGAFAANAHVREVVLPEGVTEIGSYAFFRAEKLEKVNVPGTVSRIGSCAFAHAPLRCTLYVPATVREIGRDAFTDSVGLTLAGEAGSAINRYADEHGMIFRSRNGGSAVA